MSGRRVIVVGAGLGGLAAAVELARRDLDVTVVERALEPGGKMRRVEVSGQRVDAGPTVFTMRWVFEELLEGAGSRLADELDLVPADLLARHAWRAGGTLDLFADVERSAEAIGEFAGRADAQGYRDFCQRSREVYLALERSFIAAQQPGPLALSARLGPRGMAAMLRTSPFQSLWRALATHFRDPRLRQLFGRYATYVGSSPFFAPATLMLIAHVEQSGVWLVRGGIHAVARALHRVGERAGARYRFGCDAAEILMERGRVSGVRLVSGEQLGAEAVVFNGDVQALANGLLGTQMTKAARAPSVRERSLSAVTWCVHGRTSGFELAHHNVFFAEDYAAEFGRIFCERGIVEAPTVYLCAQDRGEAAPSREAAAAERMLLLVNAPADGDSRAMTPDQLDTLRARVQSLVASCGLQIDPAALADGVVTEPAEFHRLFPGSGGALYGAANHGPFASFSRPGARSSIPGLYLAGGSVHPGAGIPMATMSGRLAAECLLRDLR